MILFNCTYFNQTLCVEKRDYIYIKMLFTESTEFENRMYISINFSKN